MYSVFILNQNRWTLLQRSGDRELVQKIATVESRYHPRLEGAEGEGFYSSPEGWVTKQKLEPR